MSTQKGKHLSGLVVTSTQDKPVSGITLPDAEGHTIVTVDASDLAVNSVSFLGESMPIFADSTSCYLGQPVVAVFAETLETAKLYAESIKISYGNSEALDFSTEPEPLDWKFGTCEPFFSDPANKVFTSEFNVQSHSATQMQMHSEVIECDARGQNIYIKVSSQWPLNLRDNVATALGVSTEKVVVFPLPYYAPYDNLIVLPSVMAPIAAAAARKYGDMVELSVDMLCYQAGISVTRTSCYNKEQNILAEKIDATVDMGAWPLFSEEYTNSMLAGFVSSADTKALSVHIKLKRSNRTPASFFGDLGYGMAVASTENHINRFCKMLHVLPSEWRMRNLCKLGNIAQSIRQTAIPGELEKCVRNLVTQSDFNRKYSAYDQKMHVTGLDSQLANYERGVGFACGESISGFSQSTMNAPEGGISVTLNEQKEVLVSCGMPPRRSVVDIWKNTIAYNLNVKAESITFININDPDVEDIGPTALSRSISVVSPLIDKACHDIASRIGKEDYPITSRVPVLPDSGTALYESTSAGAMYIELHINPVMITPVIDKICFYASYASIESRPNLETKIRHIISNAVNELCPLCPGPINMQINLTSAGRHTHAGSGTSMIRGLTAAALTDALSQAVSHEIKSMPLSEIDFIKFASSEGLL